MTKRCFSSRQLYALRNDIAVQTLIEKALGISCKVTQGCFRFLCPLCNEYNTAVNPRKNLARCFRCEQNFNTIDMVMLVRKSTFVQSVRFLQKLHGKDSAGQTHIDVKPAAEVESPTGCRIARNTPSKKSAGGLDYIGKILSGVLPSSAKNMANQKISAHQGADNERILELEQKVEHLGCQVEKILKSINLHHPSD